MTNGMKADITNKNGKTVTNICKLKSTLLNNQLVKEEITREIINTMIVN